MKQNSTNVFWNLTIFLKFFKYSVICSVLTQISRNSTFFQLNLLKLMVILSFVVFCAKTIQMFQNSWIKTEIV